jgi:hypothetical protein
MRTNRSRVSVKIILTRPTIRRETFASSGDRSFTGGDYAPITHPTQPESSSKGDKEKLRAATKTMLKKWNDALTVLYPAEPPGYRFIQVPHRGTLQLVSGAIC